MVNKRTYPSIKGQKVKETKQTSLTSKKYQHTQTKQDVPKTKQKEIGKKINYKQVALKTPKTRQSTIEFKGDKIKNSDLSQISLKEAREALRRRYKRTHPDSKKISKTTFLLPNKLWLKNPSRYDVYKFDAKEIPKVRILPEKGLKGQVVIFQDKIYIFDGKLKKFKIYRGNV